MFEVRVITRTVCAMQPGFTTWLRSDSQIVQTMGQMPNDTLITIGSRDVVNVWFVDEWQEAIRSRRALANLGLCATVRERMTGVVDA